jgi:hypothetical protein
MEFLGALVKCDEHVFMTAKTGGHQIDLTPYSRSKQNKKYGDTKDVVSWLKGLQAIMDSTNTPKVMDDWVAYTRLSRSIAHDALQVLIGLRQCERSRVFILAGKIVDVRHLAGHNVIRGELTPDKVQSALENAIELLSLLELREEASDLQVALAEFLLTQAMTRAGLFQKSLKCAVESASASRKRPAEEDDGSVASVKGRKKGGAAGPTGA